MDDNKYYVPVHLRKVQGPYKGAIMPLIPGNCESFRLRIAGKKAAGCDSCNILECGMNRNYDPAFSNVLTSIQKANKLEAEAVRKR